MEFKSVSDWRAGPGLCRCCLSDGCYKDISNEYFWKGDKEVYADMLLDCFDLTISYQECGPNSNSRLICEVCIQRLRDAFSFKKQVVSSERRFSDYVKALASGEKPDLASFHEVKVELIKGEKAPSEPAEDDDMHNDLFDNLDDDDDDDADNQPLKNFASQLPKVESDTMQDIPAFDEDLIKKEAKVVKRKYTKKATSTSSKKAKPTTDDPEASSSKIKMDKKKGPPMPVMVVRKPVILKKPIPPKPKEIPPTLPTIDTLIETKKNAVTIVTSSTAFPFRVVKGKMKCVFCGDIYEEAPAYRKHLNEEHKTYRSAAIFSSKRRDEPVRIDITDLHCKLCCVQILDLRSLIQHLEIDHQKPLNKEVKEGVMAFRLETNNFSCLYCQQKFLFLEQLDQHLSVHFQNYICDSCGQGFVTQYELREHGRQEHASSYDCNKCGKSFETFADRKEHLKIDHAKEFRYQCPIVKCRQKFIKYEDRIRHMTEAHGAPEQEYKCKSCPMIFKMRSQRSVHYRTAHLTLRPHECPECGERFISPYYLKTHMTKHSDEKNFKCHVCFRAYATKKTLKNHMRIHDNDLRYMCQICGQAFVQNYTLKQHMRIHHPTYPIDDMSQ